MLQFLESAGTRLVVAIFTLMLAMVTGSTAASTYSNHSIIDGFNRTVFGAEYAPFGYQSGYVRKYRSQVRFYIHARSSRDREAAVRGFALSLSKQISGLQTTVVSNPSKANFHIYVVDREDYTKTVREEVYRNSRKEVPGKCLVRSVFSRFGIIRSDAVIVSDEGEALFQRCKVEEILQGLGPLNEHHSLSASVFNDRSRHTSFTRFDRIILNMLYDPRIRVGKSRASVQDLLPLVLEDVRRRVK